MEAELLQVLAGTLNEQHRAQSEALLEQVPLLVLQLVLFESSVHMCM